MRTISLTYSAANATSRLSEYFLDFLGKIGIVSDNILFYSNENIIVVLNDFKR